MSQHYFTEDSETRQQLAKKLRDLGSYLYGDTHTIHQRIHDAWYGPHSEDIRQVWTTPMSETYRQLIEQFLTWCHQGQLALNDIASQIERHGDAHAQGDALGANSDPTAIVDTYDSTAL